MKSGNHFIGKLGLHVKIRAIQKIKEKLSSAQLDMFRNTCFGYSLDMQPFAFHNHLLYLLFQRKYIVKMSLSFGSKLLASF